MKNTNIIVRNLNRISAILGLGSAAKPEDIVHQPKKYPIQGYFSQREIMNFPGLDQRSAMYANNPYQYIGYLKQVAETNSKTIQDSSLLRFMAPEIAKAERILVSSIMSPNDMQDDRAPMKMATIPELDDAAQKEVLEFIQNFYNDELQLGVRLSDWIGEALVRSGSKAVLTLPKSTLRAMSDAQDLRNGKDLSKEPDATQIGLEAQTRIRLFQDKMDELDKNSLTVALEDWNEQTKTIDIFQSDENLSNFVCETLMEADPAFESINPDSLHKLSVGIRDGMASFVKTHKTKIEIGRNPFAIKPVSDAANEFISQTEKDIQAVYQQGISNPVMINIPESNSGAQASDMAIWVELPAEAVVAIPAPGSVQNHLMYMVLIGEDGIPIASKTTSTAHNSTQGVIRANARAIMDDKQLNDILGVSAAHRDLAVSAIFGVAIKNILSTELGKKGLMNMSPMQYNAIASCAFSHLALDQQIRIVCVPESMMAYYAFNYRDDGTGKAIIEDCATILSLRTTLLTANILSQMRNAIDRRKLTMDFNGKTLNPEAAMEMARELYVRKQFVGFSNDPMIAANNMAMQGFTITPKGMPGLPDNMDVTVEPGQAVHTQVDQGSLVELLTNMFIDFLIVPQSALNKTGEDEFAKTVATNNLYFCNQIRGFQRVVNEKTTKLVRNHLRFSYRVQQDLLEILNKHSSKKPGATGDTAASAAEINSKLLSKIIASIEVKLPSPNMSVSKAQFDEIKSFCDAVEDLFNLVCNEDMVPDAEITPNGIMKLIKGFLKADIARQYIADVGTSQMFNIPELADFDQSKLKSMTMLLINVLKGSKDHFKAFSKVIHDTEEGFGESGNNENSDSNDGGLGDFDNPDGGGEPEAFGEGDNNDNPEESGDASSGDADNALGKLDKLAGQ